MDAEITRVEERVRRWFGTTHPSRTMGRVELLVTEAARHVLAVRFREEGLAGMTTPTPFLVVTVDRATLGISEIDLSKSPQYRLMVRGRK